MVDNMPKHIASGLKYLAAVKLKNQGKSQQFIADELKVDRSTVSHYFNGRNLSWNSIDVARTITELTPFDFLKMVRAIIDEPDQCRKIVNICKNKEYNAIIEDTCIGCGLCVSLCFMNAVSLVALKSQIDSINCCGCLSCKDGCPTNSIKILEI
ncbi:4Fe-4S binding protein [Methanobrevibacter woesei]|uniref:4Fe-4S binding protein n=1 Tax=Methanobrevibacter woesei TaxID=190976 RepID=UPI002356212F|nr:4Fe-4S binding protein [Methanobrevibacter woesei]MCI7291039.1 4Fe-4S binding protein [Methanobrevibacter woesei]